MMKYKSSAWKPAKAALRRETHDKCAYCEASTAVTAHGDVEHFRPKSLYWWLAYCYDNYLFSCQICNQSYKGDNFPVLGARMTGISLPGTCPSAGSDRQALVDALSWDSSALDDDTVRARWMVEDADLVHPCFEDPEPLIRYEVDPVNEEVWLRSAGGVRADRFVGASAAFLGINREELRRDRHRMYRSMLVLKTVLERDIPTDLQRDIEAEILNLQSAAQPYAGMHRYFARVWGLPSPV